MKEITHEELALAELPVTLPTLEQVTLREVRGPWTTKAGGELTVPIGLSFADMQNFMTYNPAELSRTQRDIGGCRVYLNRDIPVDAQGGREFHRLRYEILMVINGKVELVAEDLYGFEKRFILDVHTGVNIPPFILHSYISREDSSGLLVYCNTEFTQGDPLTYDTFSEPYFRQLQCRFKS